MKIRPFIRHDGGQSAIDKIAWLIQEVEPTDAVLCFAYTTVSGYAEFNRRVGPSFWSRINSRWLTGFDYGRTEPAALTLIDRNSNTTVRIHDGSHVLGCPGLAPRRDYHLKSLFLSNPAGKRWGLLAGSGNFSRNGLSNSIEAGVALSTRDEDEYNRFLKAFFGQAEALWVAGEALAPLLPLYSAKFIPPKPLPPPPQAVQTPPDGYGRFWIDVGYVTPNRGPAKPGNQIDMPRGVHKFFGFQIDDNAPRNTVIGNIDFALPGGIVRSLRLGDNLMEKITLPIPEKYGFGAYDGKIIEFSRANGQFALKTYELDDFERSLKGSSGVTYEMGSGRLYGYRD